MLGEPLGITLCRPQGLGALRASKGDGWLRPGAPIETFATLFSDAGSALDLATMLINLLLHAVGLVAGFGLLLAVGYPLTAETVLLTTFVVVFIGTALAVAK
jgi:hypothetical protein